ncbi:MAG: amidase [Actinomycetes bacterium]
MAVIHRSLSVPDSATAIAVAVRQGALDPVRVAADALERIRTGDPFVGAFVELRAEQMMAEAAELAARENLEGLALAGVPVAVKDNVAMAGHVMGQGSWPREGEPQSTDHLVVTRLRSAGALIVGLTRLPEFGLWATTDDPDVVTRAPSAPEWSAGGSSGGSGAAVAAGFVPVAHGNDGLGSVRNPAAACGVVGIKPGRGVVPGQAGHNDWYGMADNGAMGATVADTALLLSVMAADPTLAHVVEPSGTLRVAASVKPPLQGWRTDADLSRAVFAVAALLRDQGHRVDRDQPHYPAQLGLFGTMRWSAVAADAVDASDDPSTLQPRTLGLAGLGRRLRPLIRDEQLDRVRARCDEFFEQHDLLVTPVFARPALSAERWSERSWTVNVRSNLGYSAGFAGVWNLAGYPALSVPFGTHPETGTPIGVQLVAPPGRESLLLGTAAVIERLRPWPLPGRSVD